MQRSTLPNGVSMASNATVPTTVMLIQVSDLRESRSQGVEASRRQTSTPLTPCHLDPLSCDVFPDDRFQISHRALGHARPIRHDGVLQRGGAGAIADAVGGAGNGPANDGLGHRGVGL